MARLRDTLRAELEALRRLHEVTLRTASRDEPLETLLREILVAALAITGRDRGAIHMIDPAAGGLKLAVAQGFDAAFRERIATIPREAALPSAMALRRRERVVIENVAVALASSPYLPPMLAAGIRAAQATPLVGRGGDIMGIFTTHSPHPGRPDERELRLLDMLSRTAADLIEWAQ